MTLPLYEREGQLQRSRAWRVGAGGRKIGPMELRPLTLRWHGDDPRRRYALETLLVVAGLPWRTASGGAEVEADLELGAATGEAKLALPARGRIEEPRWIGEVLRSGAPRADLGERFDLLGGLYWLLSGEGEAQAPRDRHGRPQPEGLRASLLEVPALERCAAWLRRALGREDSYLPPWPEGRPFALALSHDVDYPELLRRVETLRTLARGSLGASLRTLLGRESFWQFPAWMELERAAGATSAFYFCGRRGSLLGYLLADPDPFYDVGSPRFQRLLSELEAGGWEVGLHASFAAREGVERFRQEKQRVESALRRPIEGVRHHYWNLDPERPEKTLRLHSEAGFRYDSSLGYETRSGFRRGTCSPFRPFDRDALEPLAIWQVPPSLMDDHLFGYAAGIAATERRARIDALVETVRDSGGVLCVDWHVRVLNETFFPRWGEAYRYLLSRVADAYVATPAEIARHWEEREQQLRAASNGAQGRDGGGSQ